MQVVNYMIGDMSQFNVEAASTDTDTAPRAGILTGREHITLIRHSMEPGVDHTNAKAAATVRTQADIDQFFGCECTFQIPIEAPLPPLPRLPRADTMSLS